MRVNGMEVKGLIKVDNARVYGLEESLFAATYPKALEPVNMDEKKAMQIYQYDVGENALHTEYDVNPDLLRIAKYLGKAKPGSGHDCYLKGITVQFDLCLPEYIWRQLNRYHFIDFVSSQSKMHKILELDINEQCNKFVTHESIEQLNHYINLYNNFEMYVRSSDYEFITLRDGEKIKFTKENLFNIIIANTPCGFMLTARMTTNYLQLKSIIGQREHHKMQEWIYLTDWFKTLPLVNTIMTREKAIFADDKKVELQ